MKRYMMHFKGSWLIFLAIALFSCDKTPTTSTTVDFTIDLNNQNSRPLKTQGGYIYSNNCIIAFTTNGAYVALSQSCTYDNTSVIYDGNGDKFHCPGCQSNYDDGGGIMSGPSTSPLTRYTVSHSNATTLHIVN